MAGTVSVNFSTLIPLVLSTESAAIHHSDAPSDKAPMRQVAVSTWRTVASRETKTA